MDKKTALKQFRKIEELGGDMRLAAEGWNADWKILIATILSARSLDETTIKVCLILFEKYKTIEELSRANLEDVKKIIGSVNFYINKSKNIINCAKQIVELHDGKVPLDFENLVLLSGVGRKTSNVFLSELGGSQIAVDTHVDYISHYLSWTNGKSQENIEKDLIKLFSEKVRKNINPVLVRFGKKYTSKVEKNKLLDEIGEL